MDKIRISQIAKELGKTSKEVSGLISSKTGKEFSAYLTYNYNKDNQYPNEVGISFK